MILCFFKIKVLKNIDPMLVVYDSTRNLDARRDKIRQKIDEDFAKIKSRVLGDLN
jgi:hypothetical protein